MATLQEQLETANLSNNCKVDLMNHVEQMEREPSTLPKRPPTLADANLPAAVYATTASRQSKSLKPSVQEASQRRFVSQKTKQLDALSAVSTLSAQNNSTYTKKLQTTFHGEPTGEDPFRASRSRGELTGRDEDFAHRYASALTRSAVEREPRTDEASVSAEEAYKKAYRSYTSREPSAKDLEEVRRLNFGFDENGDVGVVQKPHTCFPHSHVTCAHRRPDRCPNQVYQAEVPAVRAARDRFPGPVPIWTSTKNLHHMTGGDMHVSGHQNAASLKKKIAMETIVGPK